MLNRLIIPLNPDISKLAEEQFTRELEAIPGVLVVLSNPQTEMIYLVFQSERTPLEHLRAVLEASGFMENDKLYSRVLEAYKSQA